jgi:hypothetical protein
MPSLDAEFWQPTGSYKAAYAYLVSISGEQ